MHVIRDIKKKIALLFDWIAVKQNRTELAKPQAPDLVSLLNAYYTHAQSRGVFAETARSANLKEMNETFNYLRANRRIVLP